MYFEDLTPYVYFENNVKMKNIAWLDSGHDYNKGEVPDEFKVKLWKYMRYPVQVCRGFQNCPFCSVGSREVPQTTFDGQTREVGFYELRVWGPDDTVYAVTSLIFHYMEVHQYRPPEEFIEAVMNSEDPDREDYYERVAAMEDSDFWLKEDRTIKEK